MILAATKGADTRLFLVRRSPQGDLGALVEYLTDCGWGLQFAPAGESCALEEMSAGEISDELEPRDG